MLTFLLFCTKINYNKKQNGDTKMLKPIKLNPVFKEIIWGGNKLKSEFNKVSDLKNIAESWELTVRDDAMNTITGGDFDSLTMSECIDKDG